MRLRVYFFCLAVIVAGFSTQRAHAVLVAEGWDLLQTAPGTSFDFGGGPVPLLGVPLGSYDFAGVGVRPTGLTDTIVQRLQPTNDVTPIGTAPPINIELVALQLRTVGPITPGTLFITLQSARSVLEGGPGPASTGQMTISFLDTPIPMPDAFDGTFTSFFDVFFDVRAGALDGPIVNSQMLTLTSALPSDWGRVPPPGAVVIEDVNQNLNGSNNEQDFWPGLIVESHPSGAQHVATTALTAVPEASTVVIWSLLSSGVAATAWWQRRRAARRQRLRETEA